MTWTKEIQRHSLAKKGIRTKSLSNSNKFPPGKQITAYHVGTYDPNSGEELSISSPYGAMYFITKLDESKSFQSNIDGGDGSSSTNITHAIIDTTGIFDVDNKKHTDSVILWLKKEYGEDYQDELEEIINGHYMSFEDTGLDTEIKRLGYHGYTTYEYEKVYAVFPEYIDQVKVVGVVK